jgi:hypothetical protein
MVGAGNIGTGDSVTRSHVFCGWEGNHIEVHADFTDGLPADSLQKVSEGVTISRSADEFHRNRVWMQHLGRVSNSEHGARG